ncbi:universal stress protein [Actinoplanes sp. RD1]|uniref:universal stress protein n=1 Tax=Actinoplanes sp. RD1 TaxID=3064538 RepID=UPI002740D82C|nr:universal stress protein [Actinoplanes sp. RD1]
MGGSIAVGYSGAGGSEALARATEQAERSGARLTIEHVCVPGSPLTGATHTGLELLDPPLARAYAKAQIRLGGHRVAWEICSGDPAAELVHTSVGAHLLVIGAGEGGRSVRRIIRHTHSPVVVARSARLPAHAPFAGHVVVGDKRRGVIGRARTGDVPLTVATEATCPVAIVPVEHDEGNLL